MQRMAENRNYPSGHTMLLQRRLYCLKSVRIWSYSGPHSVQMWEKTDQNNSKYGQLSRSVLLG